MDYENIQMTRISDLPDINQSVNKGGYGGANQMVSFPTEPTENNNMYIPINPHPNPYGIPEPPPGGMIPPQQGHRQGQSQEQQSSYGQRQDQYQDQYQDEDQYQDQYQDEDQYQYPVAPPSENMLPKLTSEFMSPEYRLPQRDIPNNMSDYMYDEEIKPNYIPNRKLVKDYVDEHEIAAREKLEDYEKEKINEKSREGWFYLLHLPFFVTLLYFIFSLPVVNTVVFKRFSFLPIYREDGNFNINGLLLKAFMFGWFYLGFQQLMTMWW